MLDQKWEAGRAEITFRRDGNRVYRMKERASCSSRQRLRRLTQGTCLPQARTDAVMIRATTHVSDALIAGRREEGAG